MHIPHDDKLETVFTRIKFNHKIYKSIAPVYTAPPQRQQRTYTLRKWVGLTDEDIRKLSDDCAGVRDETEFIRAIEAKLKDKNT